MLHEKILFAVLCVCSYTNLVTSENGRLINVTRTDVRRHSTIFFQQQATEKIVEQCKVFKNASEDSTEHNGPFHVDLDYDAQHMTIPAIRAFFELTEDTNNCEVPDSCTQNTVFIHFSVTLL